MKQHSDVLVVGGGIIGLTCAYYLCRAGLQVRIIEEKKIGTGASHGNCGLIFSSHLLPLCAPGVIAHELKRFVRRTSPLHIKLGPDIQRFLWLVKFARKCSASHLAYAIRVRESIQQHSQQLYHALLEDEKLDCDWEKNGVLLVFKHKSEMQKYAHTNAYLKPYGLAAKPYVGKALSTLEPALGDDVYGGWYHPGDTHLRPDRLLAALKTCLLKRGVKIEEDAPLFDLVHTNRQVIRALTAKGEFTAGHYVLAAGAWTPKLVRSLKIRLPLQPGKGYSITMARPEICPRIPCYLYEKSVVATPWRSGYRLGGTMEFSGYNTRIVTKRIEHLKAAARQYLKTPLSTLVYEEWMGWRPMIYDDLPVIGPIPGYQNLLLATGHGMVGLSTATSTGKLVTEMIKGHKPHIDPKPFRVERFQ